MPGLQAPDAVSNGTVEMCHTVSYYYCRQGPDLRASASAVPFGLNCAAAERLAVPVGGGNELINEFYRQVQHPRHARRQHRRADGRLVPQGDQDRRRPEGPQDAHRRLRRPGAAASSASCRSRSPAATSTRRSRRAPSTPPNGSAPTTTRSSASTRSRPTTTIPASGKAARRSTSSSTRRSGTSCRRATRRSSRPPPPMPTSIMLAKYDAPEPAGAASSLVPPAPSCGRSRRRDPGGLLQGRQRGLRRDSAQERRLQEDLRQHGGLPRRRVSVVAGRRVHLRHLHDPRSAQTKLRRPAG